MKIAVLGTGMVGRTLGGRLADLGHQVAIGTRDPAATMAMSDPDRFGNLPIAAWFEGHGNVELATFADAAAHSEMVINATNGSGSLPALQAAGSSNLKGKVLIDVANPLDFSRGFPPTLSVVDTDSLGEQIQREFADALVVKTLNTTNAFVMVDPSTVAGGDHTIFICGNDEAAKDSVRALLESFGWGDIIDIGDISGSRACEMMLPMWLRLVGSVGGYAFNFKVAR